MAMITEAELREAVKRGLLAAGKEIVKDTRRSLPKRTGRLRRGLKVGLDKGNAIVMRFGWPKGPFYAAFIERGRKASSSRTRPTRARALRIGGDIRASARGSSLPARKHLETAIESSKARAVIEREIGESITPLFRDIVIGPDGKVRFK